MNHSNFRVKCQASFPKPAFSQIVRIDTSNENFIQGDSVSFACLSGYYVYKSEIVLKTVCLSDGTRSMVDNCKLSLLVQYVFITCEHVYFTGEPFPCWNKIPSRPLNGRRDVSLYLVKANGFTNGSYVNFSCNPFFELIGQQKVFCKNGIWENAVPQCVLSTRVCRNKPPPSAASSYIISQKRQTLNIESSYGKTDPLVIYLEASYTCNWPDMNFTNTTRPIEYRALLNSIGKPVLVFYQTSLCLGNDTFEQLPSCS